MRAVQSVRQSDGVVTKYSSMREAVRSTPDMTPAKIGHLLKTRDEWQGLCWEFQVRQLPDGRHVPRVPRWRCLIHLPPDAMQKTRMDEGEGPSQPPPPAYVQRVLTSLPPPLSVPQSPVAEPMAWEGAAVGTPPLPRPADEVWVQGASTLRGVHIMTMRGARVPYGYGYANKLCAAEGAHRICGLTGCLVGFWTFSGFHSGAAPSWCTSQDSR